MRKVIYGINLTADGCCDHTKNFGGGDEMHDYFSDLMEDVDLIIYGRRTYELMVPYWPDLAKAQSGSNATNRFAQTFDNINKVVFSKTLDKVDGNAKLIRSNLAAEVLKLKQEPGKNISIGGVDLPSQLIALGLVDEFYFLVHPTIVGEGRRLFDHMQLSQSLNLKLERSRVLNSGCVELHYVNKGDQIR